MRIILLMILKVNYKIFWSRILITAPHNINKKGLILVNIKVFVKINEADYQNQVYLTRWKQKNE